MNTRQLAVQVLPGPAKKKLLRTQRHLYDAVIKYRDIRGDLGPLPTFLVIGGQRCGSTYIYDRLCEHPNVRGALVKEVHYFNLNKRYAKGLNWYLGHFPSSAHPQANGANGNLQVTGEAAGYIFHPEAPARIAEIMPEVKLIALLRNPVNRAYSHYYHMRRLGFETVSTFEEAIDLEEARLQDEKERGVVGSHYHHHTYLLRGLYADQLPWWFDVFPREQLLIIQSEEFYQSPVSVLKRVAQFLELPEWTPSEYRGHKEFSYPKMSAETQARLEEHFRPHNQRLFDLLGVDYGWNG